MKKNELIAALAWVITSLSQENVEAEEIFQILKKKEDMKVIYKCYMEAQDERTLRDTFFPI